MISALDGAASTAFWAGFAAFVALAVVLVVFVVRFSIRLGRPDGGRSTGRRRPG